MATRGNTGSAFTGGISDVILTVSNILYGRIFVGQIIAGNDGIAAKTVITAQLSGADGGEGTYLLSAPGMVAGNSKLLGNSSVGVPTFPPGGYYEATYSYDPAQGTGKNGFPSFWLLDLAGLYSANFNTGYGEAAAWVEFDVHEAPNAGDIQGDTNVFFWKNINGGLGGDNLGVNDDIHQSYTTATNMTALHSYGMLWVPSAKNGGTGFVQFYLG